MFKKNLMFQFTCSLYNSFSGYHLSKVLAFYKFLYFFFGFFLSRTEMLNDAYVFFQNKVLTNKNKYKKYKTFFVRFFFVFNFCCYVFTSHSPNHLCHLLREHDVLTTIKIEDDSHTCLCFRKIRIRFILVSQKKKTFKKETMIITSCADCTVHTHFYILT